MTAETIVSPDWDLFSDEVLLTPYPYFAEIREQAAAVWLPKSQVWALTRYDAIREALGNWEAFSSRSVAFNDQMNQALQGTSLATDPPEHTTLRAALTENLSPRALRKMKDDIDAKADALVAELLERGSFDAVQDLAGVLPASVVIDLIGLQGEIRDKMLTWGEAAMTVLGPMNQRTIENFPIAGELFQWAHGVTAEDLAEGSMGRAVFDAAARGEIPLENAPMIIHQYVAAGLDSTITALGNALALLGSHPDQFEAIRQDRSLIPSAFNEVLRYEAPLHVFGRITTGEVEVDGTLIPADSQVAVLFPSGNRDPRHYENPDVFDVRRNPVDHLSFGYGPHGCAGQGLARLDAHAMIDALARRVRRFTVGEPVRKLNNSTRGLSALPVLEFVPA